MRPKAKNDMKTPTELNVTRRPKAECATIWKNNQKTIKTAEIRRNMANIDALCLLRHTGTETIDAMNAVASAVRKTEAAPRIEMLSGPHKDPYTIAGALYTDVILNPNLDDETADVLYRTIVETAVNALRATTRLHHLLEPVGHRDRRADEAVHARSHRTIHPERALNIRACNAARCCIKLHSNPRL